MAKIFYDTTQLVHWEGSITGIPRVMNELALRFATDSKFDVEYVSWVKSRKSMLYIDFEQSIKHRGSGIRYVPKNNEDIVPSTGGSKQDYPVKVSASSVRSISIHRKLAKKGLSVMRRVHPGVAQRFQDKAEGVRMGSYRKAEPVSGDIIFIGWGEWWDDSFIQYLKMQAEKGVRIVQIIHDLLPLSDPQFSGHSTVSLGKYCEAILPVCSLVLCVSDYTKHDTVSWLKHKKLHVPEVVTFRLGDDFLSKKIVSPRFTASQQKHIIPGKFVLSVGTLEARKNFAQFYYTYKLAISRGVELPTLVHVGRRGWKTENIYDIVTGDPALTNRVFFMGGVSDEELAWYYQNCKYLAHPSFCEGWGLQIAESATYKKPVITSSTSSMPEVIKDRAMYVNPFSSDELLEAMKAMESKIFYKAQVNKVSSYRPVSWDDSYEQVRKQLQLFLKESQ